MNNEIISAVQLFVMLFVVRLTRIGLYQSQYGGEELLMELFLPSLLSGILILFLLLPAILYKKHITEKPQTPAPGTWIRVLYILYFSFMSVYEIVKLSGFFSDNTGENKHFIYVVALVIFTAAYGAYRGIEAVTRFAGLIMVMLVVALIIGVGFLFPTYDADTLPPLLSLNHASIPERTGELLSVMTEPAAIMLLSRRVRGQFTPAAVIWSIFQSITTLSLILLISGTSGEYLRGRAYPFYHMIDSVGGLQRCDPMFIGVILSGVCCVLSLHFCLIRDLLGSIRAEGQLVGLRFPMAAAVITIAALLLNSRQELSAGLFRQEVFLVLVGLFSVLIPLVILFKAKRGSKGSRGHTGKRRRAALSVMCVTAILLTMTGCQNIQLNQRLIVQGIGIESTASGYRLTFIVLDDDHQDQEKLLYAEGETVREAVDRLENQQGRSVLLSQCLFLLLDENALRQHQRSLSFFAAHPDMNKTASIMAVSNTSVLLEQTILQGDYSAEDINVLSDSRVQTQPTVHYSLFDIIAAQNSKMTDFAIPWLQLDEYNQLSADTAIACSSLQESTLLLDREDLLGLLALSGQLGEHTEGLISEAPDCRLMQQDVCVLPVQQGESYHFEIQLVLGLTGSDTSQQHIRNKVLSCSQKMLRKSLSSGFDLGEFFISVRSVYPAHHYIGQEWRRVLAGSSFQVIVH